MGEDDGQQCPECASWNIVVNDMKRQVVCKDCGGIFSMQSGAAEDVPKKGAKKASKLKKKMLKPKAKKSRK